MNVVVVNASTVVLDAAVLALLPALRTQVSRDLGPAWSLDACSLAFAKPPDVPAGSWVLAILDTTDQADALGYHDLTSDGSPLGKVFAKSDSDAGEDWRVTASHELCEMLVDPEIDRVVSAFYGGKPTEAIVEVCDPVEDRQYEIDGQPVSDFVLPPYYGAASAGPRTGYDLLGVLAAPMSLSPGGYLSLCSAAGDWTQVFGERVATWKAAAPFGSRRERLRAGRARWRRSTAV